MDEIQTSENKRLRGTQEAIRAAGATGDLLLHRFRSRIFRNERFLRVWLPPGYDDAASQSRRYPVLYLNDGQNLFEASTSFTGVEWQVDETADRLIREATVPEMIVVGIDNAGKERLREYLPHRSLHPVILRVQGARYPVFLIKEVMPFISRHYRVAQGTENTGLGGSSLGALIALYTAIARPGVIGHLLLESPSLWASNRQMIREARGAKDWPQRVFLGTGTAETGKKERDQSVVDDVRELAGILQRTGLGDDRLCLLVEDGGTHHESAWARRFPEALTFLFGKE